jgi:hypothetical protein
MSEAELWANNPAAISAEGSFRNPERAPKKLKTEMVAMK